MSFCKSLSTAWAAINPFNLPDLDPVQQIFPNSTGNRPDDIIFAHILKTMVENFKGWTFEWETNQSNWGNFPELTPMGKGNRPWRSLTFEFRFINLIKDLKVVCKIAYLQAYQPENLYDRKFKEILVNDVLVDVKDGILVVETYERLKKHFEDLEKAALLARVAMENNEKKWNLAEKFLNMKRNEQGVLVPNEAEEVE